MSQAATPPAPIPRDYYLLLAHPHAPRGLLLPEAGGWGLPHFRSDDADLWSGQVIRREVAARWGLDATVLRVPEIGRDPESQRWRWAVFALESHSPDWTPPPGAR